MMPPRRRGGLGGLLGPEEEHGGDAAPEPEATPAPESDAHAGERHAPPPRRPAAPPPRRAARRGPIREKMTVSIDTELLAGLGELVHRDGTNRYAEIEDALRRHLTSRGIEVGD